MAPTTASNRRIPSRKVCRELFPCRTRAQHAEQKAITKYLEAENERRRKWFFTNYVVLNEEDAMALREENEAAGI